MKTKGKTMEFDYNEDAYDITLEGNDFSVYGPYKNGIPQLIAYGTWDGKNIGGDCTADIDEDLWDAIENELVGLLAERRVIE